MAQIHNLESKTRYGSRYVAGFLILISSILLAGWVGFFVFLPIPLLVLDLEPLVFQLKD